MNIHHTVGDNLNLTILAVLLHRNIGDGNAGGLNLHGTGTVQPLARLGHQFAGKGVHDGTADGMARQAAGNPQLFIVFITANA